MALALAVALALPLLAGEVAAARKKAQPKEPAVSAVIETVNGKAFRMAKTKMAERLTRIHDAPDDQVFLDGSPAGDAPSWTDISSVYVAATKMPGKLREKMTSQFPRGAAGSFRGTAEDLRAKDKIVFVAVQMGGRLPPGAVQQVEVGFAGDKAMPMQAGLGADTRGGVQRFTIGGYFGNGSEAVGATDLSGRQPGQEIQYYNVESGAFGFYDRGKSTWFLAIPRTGGTEAITVTVWSNTDGGDVLDRLEMPGGGHFIDLTDPSGGYSAAAGKPALACRSLETFSAVSGVEGLSDANASLVRYTAGVEASATPKTIDELLGPAIAAAGPVSVALTPTGPPASGDAGAAPTAGADLGAGADADAGDAGGDGADGGAGADASGVAGNAGQPLIVDGQLSVAPGGNAIELTFEAPPGQWDFAVAGDLELKTAAGEAIIDARSLTGMTGVLTGSGLDGLVAGDPSCAEAGSSDEGAGQAVQPTSPATVETPATEGGQG